MIALLADITCNTTNGNPHIESNASCENSVEIDLPSSVWGVVSLLLLLKGSVSMKQHCNWFASRAAADPILRTNA